MSAEALSCPNCGAGVASDRTLCEFCKTRLKTVGCAKCLGLMFVGSRFCGHCGAAAASVEVTLDSNPGECPRCRKPLENLQIGATSIRGCTVCDGLWVGVNTFENVCADREKQAAVLGFFDNRTVRGQSFTKVTYVPCPDCKQLMNRNNFARASGVIVDICKQHGVWFDADELSSVIEFIQKGGMDLARQREKNQIEIDRDWLKSEQRRHSAGDNRSGTWDIWNEQEESGIRTFVRALFS